MKKLTAGIFTVMLGLCAANNADAAVASKGYVDSFVGENGSITSEVATLKTTVADNKSAAETAIADAKKAGTDAAAALETYKGTNDAAVEAAQAQADKGVSDAAAAKAVADGAVSVNTTQQAAIEKNAGDITAINAELDTMATSETVTNLTTRVTTAEGKITTAEGKISDIEAEQDSQDALIAANDTAIKANAQAIATNTSAISTLSGTGEGSVSKAISDAVAGMSAEGGAVKENADAIAALEGLVGETSVDSQIKAATTDMATKTQVATDIATAVEEATLAQKNYTDGALTAYTKTEALGALAMKNTVGTDDIDNLAVTTAKLADGAVDASKLGANAVTDAAVADGALSQDKINGLDTTLATKMTITNATSETGKYVFTANVGEDGVTDYAWELIERGEDDK